MDWQKIETAPRDGTRILVVAMSYGQKKVYAVRFYPQYGFFRGEGRTLDGTNKPTHWMPLPDPPQS